MKFENPIVECLFYVKFDVRDGDTVKTVETQTSAANPAAALSKSIAIYKAKHETQTEEGKSPEVLPEPDIKSESKV